MGYKFIIIFNISLTNDITMMCDSVIDFLNNK